MPLFDDTDHSQALNAEESLETQAFSDAADEETSSDETQDNALETSVQASTDMDDDEESGDDDSEDLASSVPRPLNSDLYAPLKAFDHFDDDADKPVEAVPQYSQAPIEKPEAAEKLNEVLDAILASKPDPVQLKADIEATLFITGKALKLADIAEIVEAPVEDVEMLIGELIQDYAFREGCGLEIDDTDGYILQVREDCARIVHKMMPLELSAATIRTLSAIAIKSPILQSDLIELRGSTAYDHIAELLGKKLISKRRQGRSYVLNTTRAFDEYFKLSGDKRELEALVNRLRPEQKTAQNNEATPNTDANLDYSNMDDLSA